MSELHHGQDALKHGQDQLLWGFSRDVIDLNQQTLWHYLLDVEYDGDYFHLTTFDENIPVEGVEYIGVGTSSLQISGMPSSSSNDDVRMQIQILGVPNSLLPELAQQPGLIQVTVRYIVSQDGGNIWQVVPRSVTGHVSNPTVVGDSYSFELATDISDVDRGRPVLWSHQHQRQRSPRDDGFEHLVPLAAGIDGVGWPPR